MTDLQTFYEEVYARLVGQVRLVTGDLGEAEELVQEAFVRLVPRWSSVRDYDDPEAWVRRVAMRLTVSRWRRRQVAARGMVRLVERKQVAEPEGAHIDLSRALRELPIAQRQVLVLHYVLDLSVEDTAAELSVPAGTVKSRLSRGRRALAQVMTEEVSP